MKVFTLLILMRTFPVWAADFPLCVPNTTPEEAAGLCMSCSANDQCTPCSQDSCMDGVYSIQFDDEVAWSMTSLTIISSSKDSAYDPDQMTIRGSDSGLRWEKVTTNALSWSSRSEVSTMHFDNGKQYKSYKVELNKLDGSPMYIGQLINPKMEPPTNKPTTSAPTSAPTNAPSSGWTMLYKRGSISGTAQPELWNNIDQGSYILRICNSCSKAAYKGIVYKRLTPKGTINFQDLFLQNWFSDPAGDGTNLKGSDFNLFSNLDDAKNNRNPWTFCNYNDPGIGFPRDCGPSGGVGGMWNSLTRGGQTEYAYYLLT